MAMSAIIDRPGSGPRHRPRVRVPLWIGLALVVIPALWWLLDTLTDPRFMPVTAVRVDGEFRHQTRAQLHAEISSYAAGGFFSVDADAVRRAALRLPWVASASVRRVWPDTLQVAVTEHKPVARWGASALLNEQGAVFTPAVESFPSGLPLLLGPPGLETVVMERMARINSALQPLRQQVLRLALDERRAWSVTLNNSVELLLGREDIDARVQRYVAAYPSALELRVTQLTAVDLRYTNGFAARWAPAVTTSLR